MWSVVTTNAGLSLDKNAVRFLRQDGAENITVFDEYATPEIYLQLALEGINIIIGDGVVIWRTWILWNQRRWVLVVSSFLLLGTGVTVANVTYALSISPVPLNNLFDDPRLSTWGIAAMTLTTMTDLFATSLIVYRAWIHHRLLRSAGGSVISQFCKQNGILALLIESGVFYCGTWLATIIIFVATNYGINLMLDVLSQLTAIYPTLIIILVSPRSTLDVAIQNFEQTCWQPSTISPRPLAMHTAPLSIAVETAVYVSSENIESFPVDSLKSQDIKDSTTLC